MYVLNLHQMSNPKILLSTEW